jgi:hypothetical protein
MNRVDGPSGGLRPVKTGWKLRTPDVLNFVKEEEEEANRGRTGTKED